MQIDQIPFNIDLLTPSLSDLKTLKPVTTLDIFEGSTKNFHPDGLFSTDIFGKVGTDFRNRLFAYIDLKVPIIHPVIFKAIGELREMYINIIDQKDYVIWDPEAKDFVKSNALEGGTGIELFLQHFNEIKFEERDSDKRSFNIKLVNKYRERCLLDKLLVLPAGLRDYSIDESGKPSEDEVNTLYRKALSLSNLITREIYKVSPESLNSTRSNLQSAVVDIYNYFRGMLEGKSKFIQSKWAARKVFNSTRNVITSLNNDITHADDPTVIKYNETAIGLYQYAKATVPLSIHHLTQTYLSKVFPGPNSPAFLVNPKTLKKEMVNLKSDYYDEWMSQEGLEGLLNRYGERITRHEVLMVDKYYLGLVYKGKDMSFKFLQDIDDVPDPNMREFVSPITFSELLYMSLYRDSNKIPGYLTRYPIAGYGSIYPSYVHLKTTVPSEVRTELDDNWQIVAYDAVNFPIRDANFFDTLAPHQSHIGKLTADYDGDTCSFTCLLLDESREEIDKKLNSANYYVDANGEMAFSGSTDVIKWVLSYMTA